MTFTNAKLNFENSVYDCIVVGAGPAGLSAALFLARYRRSVLVLHHSQPRNAMAEGVHGFLGHDGIPPAELLSRGRAEVVNSLSSSSKKQEQDDADDEKSKGARPNEPTSSRTVTTYNHATS